MLPARRRVLFLLLGLPAAARAADPSRTAKERQGGKATDEQRVDDCKVPVEKRTRQRPAGCGSRTAR